jgi:hypothetical protein
VRFIHLYLLVYFLLLMAAGLTLWHAGAFGRVPLTWVAMGAIVTIGLGVLLAITSSRRTLHD